MGAEFVDIGNHKNVYSIRFDKGDLFYAIAGSTKGRAILSFYNQDGTLTTEQFINKDIDDTPLPECALVFSNPLQINDFIQMLLLLQSKYFT